MTFDKYVQRFLGKIEQTLELYGRHIFTPILKVEDVLALETDEHLRRPPSPETMRPIKDGESWGREYSSIWLSARVRVPEAASGQTLCAVPEADAVEILCFKNGSPRGIINSKNRFIGGNHSVMFVDYAARAGEEIDLAFECYAGHTVLGTQPREGVDLDEEHVDQAKFSHVYNGLKLYVLNETVKNAVFDLSCALQMARLSEDNYASQHAYECLKDAFPHIIQEFVGTGGEEITESCRKVSQALRPLFGSSKGDLSRGEIYAIGHSHMDTAWLWPVNETVRKCARTYSQALNLMERYPDYKFIQSSALHLDWMRRYYPDIFEGIRQRCKEGRYEPNGGVWVECDCSITGGEAMARQFIYGQNFTRKYLGYTSDSFWLPDTFGYNAAIPQIMLESGVKYFFTTKMSWNDLNTFPAGSFVWKGLDGSKVLCHLNATHSVPDPKTVTENYARVLDRRTENSRFAAYGFGDGGGGPTFGMLEYFERVKGMEGLPKVVSSTASEYMHTLEARRDRLPTYDGEMYLELHRGTLTKMSEVKRFNRLAEIALHDLELMYALNGKPKDEKLEEYWKTLLKNQFHDILPGTCIPKVYETELPEMEKLISDVRADSMRLAGAFSDGAQNAVSLINTLPYAREGVYAVSGRHSFKNADSQTYPDLFGQEKTAVAASLPASGALTLEEAPESTGSSAFKVDGKEILTPFYRVRLSENGFIDSLYDIKNEREIRSKEGLPLGTVIAGEEMPAAWDNWDIDDDGFDKLRPLGKPESFGVVSNGQVELRLRAVYPLMRRSKLSVDTVFYAASRRVDYEVKLDWQDRHGLVKACFDTDIRSAYVKNEIQFGHIERPTTRNNSIEAAKFEVCNMKWSDLSEADYGVAVLNDCKYGISCLGGNLRLSLLKGGARPDPVTDLGTHYMRYSLLPHEGVGDFENVILPAYDFNYLPVEIRGMAALPQLFAIEGAGVIAEAVKPAENGTSAFALRLYESRRSHAKIRVSIPGAKKVSLTNFLEEEKQVLSPDGGGKYSLCFRPFEIKTLLVER